MGAGERCGARESESAMHSVIKSNLLQLSECRNRKRCWEGVRGERGLRENSGSAIFDLANWFFFLFSSTLRFFFPLLVVVVCAFD